MHANQKRINITENMNIYISTFIDQIWKGIKFKEKYSKLEQLYIYVCMYMQPCRPAKTRMYVIYN